MIFVQVIQRINMVMRIAAILSLLLLQGCTLPFEVLLHNYSGQSIVAEINKAGGVKKPIAVGESESFDVGSIDFTRLTVHHEAGAWVYDLKQPRSEFFTFKKLLGISTRISVNLVLHEDGKITVEKNVGAVKGADQEEVPTFYPDSY